jgi:hypothetical protein
MDPRTIQMTYRVEHGHRDGSWGEMVETRSPHDAAESDPERGWGQRRIFRCATCDESVAVQVGEEPESPFER